MVAATPMRAGAVAPAYDPMAAIFSKRPKSTLPGELHKPKTDSGFSWANPGYLR